MKKLILFLLLAALPLLLRADGWFYASGTTPGATYLVAEDFEGTGTPDGWSSSGTVDYDFVTTVLAGSQSLGVSYGSSNSAYAQVAFDGQDTVWVYCQFQCNALFTSADTILGLYDSSGNYICQVNMDTNGVLYLKTTGGEASSDTTAALEAGTTYHLWLQCTKGTGNNGTSSLYISETSTRPASPDKSDSDGDFTNQISRVRFQARGQADQHCIFDEVHIDDAEIGSM